MGSAPTYPRSQLARDSWQDLCGRWSFCFDDEDRGLDERWWDGAAPFDREIVVPYPPESKLSEVHDNGEHPVLWYRRSMDVAPPNDQQRVILHFGAVDYSARVWVNGQFACQHEGGHTPFSVDITPLLNDGEAQDLVVRAADPIPGIAQPRGKQDWAPEPHKIWYHRTSGIWQSTWVETVPDLHVVDVAWTPNLERSTVAVSITLSRPPTTDTWVDVSLRRHDQVVAEQHVRCLDEHVETVVAIPAGRHDQDLDDLLWSPESPNLIDATIRLRSSDDASASLDEVSSYFGYRSVGVDRGRFLLNGRPYFLRMVLEQGYWPQSHLAAPDASALRREVELIKELGFNGVRIHQKIEDPRFLHECDRQGLLVWAEMPSAYSYSTTATARTVREWMEVVTRDRSHPCIAAWVPLNESWGVRWIASRRDQQALALALYHLTHSLDPTRPVISNDGWEHPAATDIIGVHDYAHAGAELAGRYGDRRSVEDTLEGWGPGPARALLDPATQTGQPVMVTEFGGIGLSPHNAANHHVYSRADDGGDFLRRLRELVAALDRSSAIAGFCYTQLTDTEQEVNGLLTAEREPKVPTASVRAIVTGLPHSSPSPSASASDGDSHVEDPGERPRPDDFPISTATGRPDSDEGVMP